MPRMNNFKGTTHDYIALKYILQFLECHRIKHVGMLIYSLIPEMAYLEKKGGWVGCISLELIMKVF